MVEVFNTEVSPDDPAKREGGSIRPIPAISEVAISQDEAAIMAEIFSKSFGGGAIGTGSLALEAPAFAFDLNRGRQVLMGNRVRQARDISEEDFNTLSRNIIQSDFTNPKKMAFITAARDIRSGFMEPDAALEIVNIPERDENISRSIQQGLNKFVDLHLNLSDEEKATFTAQIGGGLGSAGTFILTRFIPGIGQVSLPAFASLVGAGESLQRATAAGADDETKATSALFGALVGQTDIVPINRLFKPFIKIKGFKGALFGLAGALIKQGAIEGSQEALQEFLQNSIARLYDPHYNLLESVEDQGIVGFVVGGILGVGGRVVSRKGVAATAIRDKIFSNAPISSDLIDPQTNRL